MWFGVRWRGVSEEIERRNGCHSTLGVFGLEPSIGCTPGERIAEVAEKEIV